MAKDIADLGATTLHPEIDNTSEQNTVPRTSSHGKFQHEHDVFGDALEVAQLDDTALLELAQAATSYALLELEPELGAETATSQGGTAHATPLPDALDQWTNDQGTPHSMPLPDLLPELQCCTTPPDGHAFSATVLMLSGSNNHAESTKTPIWCAADWIDATKSAFEAADPLHILHSCEEHGNRRHPSPGYNSIAVELGTRIFSHLQATGKALPETRRVARNTHTLLTDLATQLTATTETEYMQSVFITNLIINRYHARCESIHQQNPTPVATMLVMWKQPVSETPTHPRPTPEGFSVRNNNDDRELCEPSNHVAEPNQATQAQRQEQRDRQALSHRGASASATSTATSPASKSAETTQLETINRQMDEHTAALQKQHDERAERKRKNRLYKLERKHIREVGTPQTTHNFNVEHLMTRVMDSPPLAYTHKPPEAWYPEPGWNTRPTPTQRPADDVSNTFMALLRHEDIDFAASIHPHTETVEDEIDPTESTPLVLVATAYQLAAGPGTSDGPEECSMLRPLPNVLLDTGGAISAVDENTATDMRKNGAIGTYRMLPLEEQHQLRLAPVGGGPVSVTGEARFTICIQDKLTRDWHPFSIRMHVISGPPLFLIGNTFNRPTRVVADVCNGTAQLTWCTATQQRMTAAVSTTRGAQTAQIFAAELSTLATTDLGAPIMFTMQDEIIQPHSSQAIQVRVPAYMGGEDIHAVCLDTNGPDAELYFSKMGLRLAETPYEALPGGFVTVRVENASDTAVHLTAHSQVGYALLSPELMHLTPSDLSIDEIVDQINIHEGTGVSPERAKEAREQVKSLINCSAYRRSTFSGKRIGKCHAGLFKAVLKAEYQSGEKPPPSDPARPLNKEQERCMKAIFEDLLKQKVISSSSSPFGAPLVMVKKPNSPSEYRMASDYRRTNAAMVKQHYPLPNIKHMLESMGKAKFWTCVDCISSFFQVMTSPCTVEMTAVQFPWGKYQWNCMPMGLQAASATFQTIMERILVGLNEHTISYVDDIVCFSATWEQHLLDVAAMLDRLCSAGITLRPKKCFIGMPEVHLLGHIVNAEGTRPDPKRLQPFIDMKFPTAFEDLQHWVGVVQWFGNHVPECALTLQPLRNRLTRKINTPPSTAEQHAFDKLNRMLTSDEGIILLRPDFEKEFQVSTDAASTVGASAILLQENELGELRPISYWSRCWTGSEKHWAPVVHEGCAAYRGITEFWRYLSSNHFKLIVDAEPLMWLQTVRKPAGKLAVWAIALQSLDFTIIHEAGVRHIGADAISRLAHLMQPPDETGAMGTGQITTNALDHSSVAAIEQDNFMRSCGYGEAQVRRFNTAAAKQPQQDATPSSSTTPLQLSTPSSPTPAPQRANIAAATCAVLSNTTLKPSSPYIREGGFDTAVHTPTWHAHRQPAAPVQWLHGPHGGIIRQQAGISLSFPMFDSHGVKYPDLHWQHEATAAPTADIAKVESDQGSSHQETSTRTQEPPTTASLCGIQTTTLSPHERHCHAVTESSDETIACQHCWHYHANSADVLEHTCCKCACNHLCHDGWVWGTTPAPEGQAQPTKPRDNQATERQPHSDHCTNLDDDGLRMLTDRQVQSHVTRCKAYHKSTLPNPRVQHFSMTYPTQREFSHAGWSDRPTTTDVNIADTDFVDEHGRKQAAKAIFYDESNGNIYCWRRRKEGNLDVPGGKRTTADACIEATLARECQEEVHLPTALTQEMQPHRLLHHITSTALEIRVEGQRYLITVWFFPTTYSVIQDIRQTKDGTREGNEPLLRSAEEFKTSALYGSIIGNQTIAKTDAHSCNRFSDTAPPSQQQDDAAAHERKLEIWNIDAVRHWCNRYSNTSAPSRQHDHSTTCEHAWELWGCPVKDDCPFTHWMCPKCDTAEWTGVLHDHDRDYQRVIHHANDLPINTTTAKTTAWVQCQHGCVLFGDTSSPVIECVISDAPAAYPTQSGNARRCTKYTCIRKAPRSIEHAERKALGKHMLRRDKLPQHFAARIAFFSYNTTDPTCPADDTMVYCWCPRAPVCWQTRSGATWDMPGGQANTKDTNAADTARRHCREQLILPAALEHALEIALATPGFTADITWGNSVQYVTVWLIPTYTAQMSQIKLTPAAAALHDTAGRRKLHHIIEQSPYGATITQALTYLPKHINKILGLYAANEKILRAPVRRKRKQLRQNNDYKIDKAHAFCNDPLNPPETRSVQVCTLNRNLPNPNVEWQTRPNPQLSYVGVAIFNARTMLLRTVKGTTDSTGRQHCHFPYTSKMARKEPRSVAAAAALADAMDSEWATAMSFIAKHNNYLTLQQWGKNIHYLLIPAQEIMVKKAFTTANGPHDTTTQRTTRWVALDFHTANKPQYVTMCNQADLDLLRRLKGVLNSWARNETPRDMHPAFRGVANDVLYSHFDPQASTSRIAAVNIDTTEHHAQPRVITPPTKLLSTLDDVADALRSIHACIDEQRTRAAKTANSTGTNAYPVLVLDLEYDTGRWIGQGKRTMTIALAQVAVGNHIFIFDILAVPQTLHLEEFAETWTLRHWLQEPDVVVVMHAAGSDIRLLHIEHDIQITRLFDTAIADALAMGRQPHEVRNLGVVTAHWVPHHGMHRKGTIPNIAKSGLFRQRPLPDNLFEYAYQDVAWMEELYIALHDRLVCVHKLETAYAAAYLFSSKYKVGNKCGPARRCGVIITDGEGIALCKGSRIEVDLRPSKETCGMACMTTRCTTDVSIPTFPAPYNITEDQLNHTRQWAKKVLHLPNKALNKALAKAKRIEDCQYYYVFTKELDAAIEAAASHGICLTNTAAAGETPLPGTLSPRDQLALILAKHFLDAPNSLIKDDIQQNAAAIQVTASTPCSTTDRQDAQQDLRREAAHRLAREVTIAMVRSSIDRLVATRTQASEGRTELAVVDIATDCPHRGNQEAAWQARSTGPHLPDIRKQQTYMDAVTTALRNAVQPVTADSLQAVCVVVHDGTHVLTMEVGSRLQRNSRLGCTRMLPQGSNDKIGGVRNYYRAQQIVRHLLGRYTLSGCEQLQRLEKRLQLLGAAPVSAATCSRDQFCAVYAFTVTVPLLSLRSTIETSFDTRVAPPTTLSDAPSVHITRIDEIRDVMPDMDTYVCQAIMGDGTPLCTATCDRTIITYDSSTDAHRPQFSFNNPCLDADPDAFMGQERGEANFIQLAALQAADEDADEEEAAEDGGAFQSEFRNVTDGLVDSRMDASYTLDVQGFIPSIPRPQEFAEQLFSPMAFKVDFVAEQQHDSFCRALHDFLLDGTTPEMDDDSPTAGELRKAQSNFCLQQGVVCRWVKDADDKQQAVPVVPVTMQLPILTAVHGGILHLGHKRMVDALEQRVWWKSLKNDVNKFLRECETCCRNKPDRITHGDYYSPDNGNEPWEVVHVDKVFLEMTASGNDSAMVFICRFCRDIMALPCSPTVDSVGYLNMILFSLIPQNGVPRCIVSDRGSMLISRLVKTVFKILGITSVALDSHTHRGVGVCERFNHTLRDIARATYYDNHYQWDCMLPLIVFAYRTTLHTATGSQPFYSNHGRHARQPFEGIAGNTALQMMSSSPHAYVQRQLPILHAAWAVSRSNLLTAERKHAARHHKRYGAHRRSITYEVGDLVLILQKGMVPKMELPTCGPFRVEETLERNRYRLQLSEKERLKHPIFPGRRLRYYPRSADEALQEGDGYWDVDRVLAIRENPDTQEDEFKVRWLGYSARHDTWEPLSSLGANAREEALELAMHNMQHCAKANTPDNPPSANSSEDDDADSSASSDDEEQPLGQRQLQLLGQRNDNATTGGAEDEAAVTTEPQQHATPPSNNASVTLDLNAEASLTMGKSPTSTLPTTPIVQPTVTAYQRHHPQRQRNAPARLIDEASRASLADNHHKSGANAPPTIATKLPTCQANVSG